MTIDEAKKIYLDVREKNNAFGLCFYLNGLDIETECAPGGCLDYRSKQLSVIDSLLYDMNTSENYKKAVETLNENKASLDCDLAHEIEVSANNMRDLALVPKDEYLKYSELVNKAYPAYVKAKTESDYSVFEPYMDKIVKYLRKYVKWVGRDGKEGYDVLLDKYEPGYTAKDYDKFFVLLRQKLVPFIKKIVAKTPDVPEFAKKLYPKAGQVEFCEYLRHVMCFDNEYTGVLESEHPFTTNNGSHDVRITNHYHEDLMSSAIFSAIHEMGHGLYELQIDDKFEGTNCSGGASLAMHESQSRLMENMVGRSLEFWQIHFPKLKEIFKEQLDGVSCEDFYRYANRVEYSLIRTEADELTYPIHVMIRYEIEKDLISGKIDAKDIPTVWNKKYFDYMGIRVPNDKNGCLQDMHWSDGSLGYFPTYALGSAYAAQIYDAMSKDVDIPASVKSGTVRALEDWLREHLHKYGASKYPKELLKIATGKEFDPNYYIDYLIKKYSDIYGI